MLRDILSKAEKSELLEQKYKLALSGFAINVNEIGKKKQYTYAKVLKDTGFSRFECKSLGFEFGKILWLNCGNTADRCLGLCNATLTAFGLPAPPKILIF
jgi:hypothetical protein